MQILMIFLHCWKKKKCISKLRVWASYIDYWNRFWFCVHWARFVIQIWSNLITMAVYRCAEKSHAVLELCLSNQWLNQYTCMLHLISKWFKHHIRVSENCFRKRFSLNIHFLYKNGLQLTVTYCCIQKEKHFFLF